jgi:hypothetical protein
MEDSSLLFESLAQESAPVLEENARLKQEVGRLGERIRCLEEANSALQQQIRETEDSYAGLLAAQHESRSQEAEWRQIGTEIRMKELEMRLALCLRESEVNKISRPIEHELVALLKASEGRIKDLEAQLSSQATPA